MSPVSAVTVLFVVKVVAELIVTLPPSTAPLKAVDPVVEVTDNVLPVPDEVPVLTAASDT